MSQQPFRFAGHSLEELIDLAGTPSAYVYSRKTLSKKAYDTRAALPEKVQLHYSIKANPHSQTVAHLADLVDGMDVSSHAELLLALGSGLNPEKISFSGPGKTDREILSAITAGIVLHAESLNEIERLCQMANSLQKTPRIAIRINPDFTVKQSGMVMGGGPQPFGIDLEQIDSALNILNVNGVPCAGLHCYAGSQMLNAHLVCTLHQQTMDMMLDIVRRNDLTDVSLNLGGGFGVPYFSHESSLDVHCVGEHLSNLIEEAHDNTGISSIIIELGRYLIAESGIYISRIIEKKHSRGKLFLVVEGGMNHHLAASGNLGQAIRRNFPIVGSALLSRKTSNQRTTIVSIVGPLCTPLDILASDIELPELEVGDHIAVLNSGAYGYSASPHRFLSHPAPAELLI